MSRRRGLLAVVLLGVPFAAGARDGEPYRIRNLNPLTAIFGLPSWETVVPGNRLTATAELANHFRLSQRHGDVLVLDGETLRTTLSFSHGFGDGWSIGAELPYLRQSGGVLDDLIDAWHSAFGMPDGGRNSRPEGELLFRLANPSGAFFGLDSSVGGIGDAQLKVARTIGSKRNLVAQATLKLPTGEEEILAGSGSTDWSLSVLRSERATFAGRAAGYFFGVGVLRVGDPELIDFDGESLVYTAVVGGSWQPFRRFGLKAQIDVHSAFFDSPLEEIGDPAVLATVGAWMRSSERASVEFAIVEDLHVSTAPDVVLHVSAQWLW